MDGAVKLIEAIGHLLGVLVWPAVLVFVLLRFRPAFANFFSSIGELSFKAAGVEATARVKAEAAAGLAAANASRADAGTSPETRAKGAKASAQLVTDIVTPSVLRRATRSRLLWVDDRPGNNVHERQALEALGVSIVLSTSTEDAIEKQRLQPFDIIISDMGRSPDPQAGYTLLDRLRASGDKTPFIIYAGSRSPEHQAEAKRRGAQGCTNLPDELFEMILSVLGRQDSLSRLEQ